MRVGVPEGSRRTVQGVPGREHSEHEGLEGRNKRAQFEGEKGDWGCSRDQRR